ncbi:MAG: MFS transporter, partial [Anaerolineales bacterium]
SAWRLSGIYRLIALGWGASLILLWRFKDVSSNVQRKPAGSLRAALPEMGKFFLPILLIVVSRSFVVVSISTYLPTFMSFEGATLAMAGISLSVLEGAGVVGALLAGTVSDRFGRKPVLLAAFVLSSVLMFAFLQLDQLQGWLMIVNLLLLGFFAISAQPVLLAMVQDHMMPEHRATGNGLYMSITFLVRSLVLVLIGIAGDAWGLRTTFTISAAISALAVVPMLLLPKSEKASAVTAE